VTWIQESTCSMSRATRQGSRHNALGRFPEPGDEELLAGPARNFQVFDPLYFLAEVTQHIPDRTRRATPFLPVAP
jgi:hypothetical protein